MESEFDLRISGRIQGQMLRLSEQHAVAIYLRDGVMWIADFSNGQGALVDANTWFRFNCGSLVNSHALRRMALESAMPISPEFGGRIEALHLASDIQRPRTRTWLVGVITRHVRRSRLATLRATRPVGEVRIERRSPNQVGHSTTAAYKEATMASGKATQSFAHHRVRGWLKTSLTVLGLIAAAIVAVTVDQNSGPQWDADAAPAAPTARATATGTSVISDDRLPSDNDVSQKSGDVIGSPGSGPHECRQPGGVTDDCTFF